MQIVILGGERYEAHTCISCGVWFIVPEIVIANHREVGGFHHCSNGHGQGWDGAKGETKMIQLRRERDRLQQQNAMLADERAAAERRADKEAGKRRRIERRIAGGVCPCCNRHFVKLEMHMKSKHPDIIKLPTKASA